MAAAMRFWRKLHAMPWHARWLVKWAAVGLSVLAVTYPYPHLLVRNVLRWRNPNAMIEPNAAKLRPMLDELRQRIDPSLAPPDVLRQVEKYVCRRIEYAWDWDTWGVADYLPTVEETLDAGREDCDGRAVVAASLLRGLGYRADIVSDFAHVWVQTDHGETMSPGQSKSVIASDEKGIEVRWRTMSNLPTALAYGVSPFPLGRELVVLAVLWLTLLRPGFGRATGAAGAAILVCGLLALRHGGHVWQHPIIWAQATGVVLIAGTGVFLFVYGRRQGRGM